MNITISRECPKGSICHPTFGLPHCPNVSFNLLRISLLMNKTYLLCKLEHPDSPRPKINLPQSPRELINNTLVIGGSFIVHTPRATNKFQSSFIHQLFDLFLQRIRLLIPPFEKERRFNVDEPLVWIAQ